MTLINRPNSSVPENMLYQKALKRLHCARWVCAQRFGENLKPICTSIALQSQVGGAEIPLSSNHDNGVGNHVSWYQHPLPVCSPWLGPCQPSAHKHWHRHGGCYLALLMVLTTQCGTASCKSMRRSSVYSWQESSFSTTVPPSEVVGPLPAAWRWLNGTMKSNACAWLSSFKSKWSWQSTTTATLSLIKTS